MDDDPIDPIDPILITDVSAEEVAESQLAMFGELQIPPWNDFDQPHPTSDEGPLPGRI